MPIRWCNVNPCNYLDAVAEKPLSGSRGTSTAMPALGQHFSYSPNHGSHRCPWGMGWLHRSCGHRQHNPSCRHTCSARKRHFNFIDLSERPHLLPKKGLRQQNLFLIYFPVFFLVPQDLEMWRYFLSRASSSITAHTLPDYLSTLIPCTAWLWEGHLKMMVSIFISSFSGNDTDLVNSRKRRGVNFKASCFQDS